MKKGFALPLIFAVVFLVFIYWFFFIFSLSGACIQVLQEARNPITGQVKTFPTPCDVPLGWQKIAQSTNSKTDSQSNGTANWKTYTNTKYKFSLKYPPNWKDLSIESLLLLNNSQDEGLSMKVDRTFDDINRYLDYVKRADTELEKITEAKKINLDGIEGYRLTYTEYRPVTNEIKREHYNVIFINDKENIELFFKGKKETLDQILSTFKFE